MFTFPPFFSLQHTRKILFIIFILKSLYMYLKILILWIKHVNNNINNVLKMLLLAGAQLTCILNRLCVLYVCQQQLVMIDTAKMIILQYDTRCVITVELTMSDKYSKNYIFICYYYTATTRNKHARLMIHQIFNFDKTTDQKRQ